MTLGESAKPGDGVHIAVDRDDLLDGVERAEMLLQHGELQQRAGPRGGVAFFDGAVAPDRAGDDAVRRLRDDAGEEDEVADRLRRHVVAAGRTARRAG